MQRPEFSEISSGAAFNKWYWLKEEMVEICKSAGLPYHGSKFTIRDRIIYALDNNGAIKPEPQRLKAKSKFNWAKETLSLDTLITDNISFGPNFRRFMSSQLGSRFSCHSDFMNWVKSNTGKTLQDAAMAWEQLEQRKLDPNFKRDIAANNMYSQYIRDFSEDNPGATIQEIKQYWLLKRSLPTETGFIKYHPSDLSLV